MGEATPKNEGNVGSHGRVYRSYTAISPQTPHPSIFSHLNSEDVETETDISEGPPTLRKNLSVIPGKMLGRMNTRERFPPRSFGVNSSEKNRIFRDNEGFDGKLEIFLISKKSPTGPFLKGPRKNLSIW